MSCRQLIVHRIVGQLTFRMDTLSQSQSLSKRKINLNLFLSVVPDNHSWFLLIRLRQTLSRRVHIKTEQESVHLITSEYNRDPMAVRSRSWELFPGENVKQAGQRASIRQEMLTMFFDFSNAQQEGKDEKNKHKLKLKWEIFQLDNGKFTCDQGFNSHWNGTGKQATI